MSFELADAPISRRQACAAVGGALALCAFGGLTGCSESGGSSDTRTGFASDAEVKSYDLTLRLICDENLERGVPADKGLGRVETYISRYQAQSDRGNVTFALKYYSTVEMARMAQSGFEDADAIIGIQGNVELAVQNGYAYGGAGNASVRSFTSQLFEQAEIVRAAGSSVEMPKADTINGEDSSDGQFNRLQKLGEFEGKIAIPSDSLIEGVLANKSLARWSLYTSDTGLNGTYADSIKDKLVHFDDLESEVRAIVVGTCQIGFAVKSMLWGDFSGIEGIYEPMYSSMSYAGASLTNAAQGGVARDFLEFITRTV